MAFPSNTSLSLFLKLGCFYVFLLAWHGYSFGDSDHIELMSYVKWLNNNTLYPNDFYIQHIVARIPNERIVMAEVLSWAGAYLDYATFALHALSSMLLLLGVYRIAALFLKYENSIWLFFLLFFIPFYKFNLGGNDIYYSAINLSKVCGVWVLYFMLRERFLAMSVVGIAATLFHPMAGLQISLLAFGAYFLFILEKIFIKKITTEYKLIIKKYWQALLLYVATAGIWIVLMFLHFKEGQLSPSLFQEIIDFRLPHHFVPTQFGLKNYLILVPVFIVGLFYFRKKDQCLFYFFCISILGLIIYTLGICILKNYNFVSTQWFKTTIWLKLLSVLALVASFEQLLVREKLSYFKLKTIYFFPILAIFSLTMMYHPISFFKSKDYHFPFVAYQNAEIDIALLAKATTPKDAQFLTPASCTAFKFYSERGSYIDFKAVTHSKDAFAIWYERIQEVYRVGGKNATIKGLAVTALADENYANCKENNFIEMKKKGVTHLLCEKKQTLNFTKVAENQRFIIYQL
jgi:hypothetical protein